jgi:hypothetical protein
MASLISFLSWLEKDDSIFLSHSDGFLLAKQKISQSIRDSRLKLG